MDIAGRKIRTKLLCKGKEKGKVKIKEGELVWLADHAGGFTNEDIVISPNEPGIIKMLKKGERVFIDDGIIKCVVETIKKDRAALRIVPLLEKHQIKTDKGLNFPDSEISISPITDFDKTCLPFICEHANMVGFSFVCYPSDMENLQQILKKLSRIHH